eukprot:8763329-Alexandrium_andersonii.AAC.1
MARPGSICRNTAAHGVSGASSCTMGAWRPTAARRTASRSARAGASSPRRPWPDRRRAGMPPSL